MAKSREGGEDVAPDEAAGGCADGEHIISLHAGYETEGAYTDGFLARPADGQPRPGVVLLSGMGGMTWMQREITRLVARAGFVALSPEFMGNLEALDRTERLHAKNSLDIKSVVANIAGGAAFLGSLPWVAPRDRIGVLGFCVGGGLALLSLARTDAFHAGVIYHQSLFPDMRELAGIDCRLQCHYGTDDHSTPRSEVDAFTRMLDRLGKSYELHWYENMGHSFAQITPDDDIPAAQRSAADLSYTRAFEFLRAELGGGGAEAEPAQAEKEPAAPG